MKSCNREGKKNATIVNNIRFEMYITVTTWLLCSTVFVHGLDFSGTFSWNTRSLDRYLEFASVSHISCAVQCARRRRCQSINYSPFLLYCELNYAERTQSALDGSSLRYSFVHSDIKTWNLGTILGQCANHKCSLDTRCNMLTGKCEPSDCGLPVPVPGAWLYRYGHHEVGSSVVYRCTEDRVMTDQQGRIITVGFARLSCSASGLWDLPTFQCKDMNSFQGENMTSSHETNTDLITTKAASTTSGTTPWVAFEKHQYTVVNTERTWADAKKACSYKGAYLIEINTRSEMKFANILADGDFWVGGRLSDIKQNWIWDNSNTIIGLSVAKYCVVHFSGQNCVKWSSNTNLCASLCRTKSKFICEK